MARDPDTGQFVSGDGGGISYSDHDVHHIKHIAFAKEQNPDDYLDVQRFEITERGLDPDEIAELRHMRLSIGTYYQNDGSEVGPAVVKYEVDTGYNLAEGEFVTSETSQGIDNDGDSTDEYTIAYGDTDEVGQLYHEQGTVVGPQDDDTSGNAHGASFRHDVIDIDMADMFGAGPFVDSADDFVSAIKLNPNRINGQLGINLRYSLFYNVQKTEGGRSRFGR